MSGNESSRCIGTGKGPDFRSLGHRFAIPARREAPIQSIGFQQSQSVSERVPTMSANPLRNIDYDPELFQYLQPEKIAPLLTVPVGLAMRKVR